MKFLIEIKNLFKYGINKTILKDISFNIKKGSVIAIIGDNGVGKTTLIKTIIGMYPIDSGSIEYNFEFKNHPSEKMSLLFQNQDFIKSSYVKNLVNFFTKNVNPERINSINELSKILKIQELLNMKIKILSGGQEQKVGLFLAFLENSEILLLDEFSNHIDPQTKEKLKYFLKKYSKKHNVTILIVTHDMHNEIIDLCNRVIWLENSKIKKDIIFDTDKTDYKKLNELLNINKT